jgi:signal transduction histidine kinase
VKPPRFIHDYGDALLAVALTLFLQLEIWLPGWGVIDDPDEMLTSGEQVVAAALGLAFTGALAWRRRIPLAPLALAFPVLAVTGPGGLDGTPALLLALVVAVYSVGSETRDTEALAGALGVGALVAGAVLRDPDARETLGDLLLPVFILGGAWLAGLAIRFRRDQTRAAEERAAELDRAREAEARTAVADERARIARELHDVVAHAIGVIVIQARGGRRTLDTDLEASREALGAIETTAVGALAEMRRLLGVLRADDDGIALAPRPGLRDLDRLIDQVREAGLPVELSIEGDPVELAPGVDLSAYRIVQEALTNALRHAGPASARVVVRYGGGRLDLEVTDTGPGGAAGRSVGHGLLGMRERVALYGGDLEAGPQQGGGFTVRAHLPLEPAGA